MCKFGLRRPVCRCAVATIVLSLLTGCSWWGACPASTPVIIAAGRDGYPVESIERAVEFWNAEAGREVFRIGTTHGAVSVVLVSHIDLRGCEGASGCAAPRVDASGDIKGCTVYMSIVHDVVLAHELGHCIGLVHDDGDSDSLMATYTKAGNSIRQHHLDHIEECY